MSVRRLVLAAFLLPAVFVPGCHCARTKPKSAADDMQAKIKQELAQRDEPTPSASATAAGKFDIETRMETLRDSFANQRWEDVRHDGLALVTAPIDEINKLEVMMMLIEALRETGDRDRGREMSEQFAKLYRELKDSDRLKAALKTRDNIANLLGRVKGKVTTTDRFAEPDGEPRQSFRMAEKLRSGAKDDVLEDKLPDGGTVFFSRNPEALESKVGGVSRELATAIHRDPEFDYYYAISEAPLPANAPGQKNTH